MNTLIIYYSYTGNTRKYANDLAKSENADIYEIKDQKRMGIFKTYLIGCFKALSKKTFLLNRLILILTNLTDSLSVRRYGQDVPLRQLIMYLICCLKAKNLNYI